MLDIPHWGCVFLGSSRQRVGAKFLGEDNFTNWERLWKAKTFRDGFMNFLKTTIAIERKFSQPPGRSTRSWRLASGNSAGQYWLSYCSFTRPLVDLQVPLLLSFPPTLASTRKKGNIPSLLLYGFSCRPLAQHSASIFPISVSLSLQRFPASRERRASCPCHCIGLKREWRCRFEMLAGVQGLWNPLWTARTRQWCHRWWGCMHGGIACEHVPAMNPSQLSSPFRRSYVSDLSCLDQLSDRKYTQVLGGTESGIKFSLQRARQANLS